MITFTLSYDEIFQEMHDYLLQEAPKSTQEITKSIKGFFQHKFSEKYSVLCTQTAGSEFLLDVMVTTFDPKSIIEKRHSMFCQMISAS